MKVALVALIVLCLLAVAFAQSRSATPSIPGYRYGDSALPKAPISLAELDLIKKSVLFTDADAEALRRSQKILAPHVEELVGVWYGFVGGNEHLLASFSDPRSGKPDGDYLAAVRKRFEQWVLDTAAAEYDQAWLDWQFEIARRHHRVGKNKTDGANAAPIVPFRYLQALTIPVTTTLKPFLARSGASPEEVEQMHAAWVKAVTIQAILWSYPYVRDGDF